MSVLLAAHRIVRCGAHSACFGAGREAPVVGRGPKVRRRVGGVLRHCLASGPSPGSPAVSAAGGVGKSGAGAAKASNEARSVARQGPKFINERAVL